ncbi:hypothetical protein D4764_01G0019760 [Takifugu flavidus]|uniref:Uncharacterized protein n=1 Tax=Takifugu flavidus TaxID=433684 RepID=A0A5C6PTF0_9TELE|nr:hypothetical protein D4764_01G0019760 [Takifugu flavidus]
MVIHTHNKKPVLLDIQPEVPPLTSEMARTCEISHIKAANERRGVVPQLTVPLRDPRLQSRSTSTLRRKLINRGNACLLLTPNGSPLENEDAG